MGRLVKKTTQSKSKDRPHKKTHSLDAKIKNVVTSSWFFFTLIRSLDSITFTKRFSLTCCEIIYKVWVVCLVFGCVTPKEAWLTPDDETEQPLSNRSTSVAGLLACPQHFYRMPQIVIFLTLNYNIFLGG